MSSKAITEKRDDAPAFRWQTPREAAPSVVEDTAPLVARWLGGVGGLFLIVLGGVSLLLALKGYNNVFGTGWGVLFVFVGLGGLLLHAANDSELQIRRAYMAFGFLWLAVGCVLSVVPYQENRVGWLFLPYGLVCLGLGLFFTTAFHRNETEAKPRELAEFIVGGLGLFLALLGFIGGTVDTKFLLSYGVILMPLGCVFLWAFIAMRGIANDLTYRVALGVGAVGLTFFLIALGRSVLPPLLVKLHWMQPNPVNYTMPNGLILMAGGLVYIALAAAYVSDRQFVVLLRRELGSLFFSPLAYFVLFGYAFLGLLIFRMFVLNTLWRQDVMEGIGRPQPALEPIVINYILSWFPVICVLILVPVLTMRLLSEEKRTGTLEMTLTAPVNETVVVVSKFLAALIFFMLVWVPWGLYLVSLRVMGGSEFDFLPVLGFAVALLFTGGAFISMGIFFSSMTRNQLIAAVFTFVGMFTLTVIFFLKQGWAETSSLRIVLNHISYVDLWSDVLQGKLASRDLLIYLSLTIFWLFLSVKVLDLRKWW